MGAFNLHLEEMKTNIFHHKKNLSENEAAPHYTLFTLLTLFNTQTVLTTRASAVLTRI